MEVERNKWGKLCILYVLAKAKSRRTQKWVFRGISASPAPSLQRRELRQGARAFTCFECCRPKSHTTSRTQTSSQLQDGCVL